MVFHDSVLCDLHVGKIVSEEVHEIFRFSKKDAFVSRRCYKFLINQQLKGPERLFVEEFNLKFRKAIDLPHAHIEISVILLVGVWLLTSHRKWSVGGRFAHNLLAVHLLHWADGNCLSLNGPNFSNDEHGKDEQRQAPPSTQSVFHIFEL